MYRLTYSYFKIDNNFHPIGNVIIKHVEDETLESVQKRFAEKKYYNDLSKFTNLTFNKIEEITKH